MLFPIKGEWALTADFNQPRPLSLPPKKRINLHSAWDISAPLGTPIIAPEDGALMFHKIWRSGKDQHADWLHPGGGWYGFSNYYQDVYGCALVFYGSSGFTYLFCHIEEDVFYEQLFARNPVWSATKHASAYNQWVKGIVTLGDHVGVAAGEVIGAVGDEGSSLGAHIHLELHKGMKWERLDPVSIWPQEWQTHQ